MIGPTQEDFSTLLSDAKSDDPAALDAVYEVVYAELKRLARHRLNSERADHSIQPTALVHETYLKLVGPAQVKWNNRGHFFAIAAQAMRRVLVDHARGRARLKRGGDQRPVTLDVDANIAAPGRSTDVIALDEALRRLYETDPAKAQVVELRFFAGLTNAETAEAMGVSLRTVERNWSFARAWLYRELKADGDGSN